MQLHEILNTMISEGKISEKTIMIASKISQSQLKQYLSGNRANIDKNDLVYLDRLAMCLGLGIALATPDERAKAILECLMDVYEFQVDELSQLLDTPQEIIQDVLDGKEIELCKKYSFAVAASYVFYVLKK